MSGAMDRRIPLPCGVQEAESQWCLSDDIDKEARNIPSSQWLPLHWALFSVEYPL